jgi:NAD(P)-dependent dehydrogenase (short-subunit alcohol dehydrogenase family)
MGQLPVGATVQQRQSRQRRCAATRYAQTMQVRGKTVLRTGATGRIGHATARQLRAEGAGLVLTGRRVDAMRDPDKLRRIFARQPAAWLMLARCVTQLSLISSTMAPRRCRVGTSRKIPQSQESTAQIAAAAA